MAVNELELRRRKIIASQPHLETVSGAVATFIGERFPLKSCKAFISPVQDLHGYEHPWPAGGGKNKLPYPFAETTKTVSGITFTDLGDGTLRVNGTATARAVFFYANHAISSLPVGDYILSRGTTVTGVGITVDAYNGNTWVKNIKTTVMSETPFSIDYDGYDRLDIFAYVVSGTTVPNAVVSPMIRLSSATDAAFTPYSNICPITGWTGAKVTRTGKNLVEDALIGYNIISNGTFEQTSSFAMHIAAVKAGKQYAITTSDEYFIGGFFKDKPTPASVTYNNSRIVELTSSFVAPIDGYVAFRSAATFSTVQLELGSTATPYEPYSGTTYSVTFPSSAGTVYGGSLDVTNGVLTVDRAEVDLGTLTWNVGTTGTTGKARYWALVTGIKRSDGSSAIPPIISSSYVAVSLNNTYLCVTGLAVGSDNDRIWIYNNQKVDLTADAFASYVAGTQLVYELATPITYQLTPQEITTLIGTNNVWADTGDVSVTYWKH